MVGIFSVSGTLVFVCFADVKQRINIFPDRKHDRNFYITKCVHTDRKGAYTRAYYISNAAEKGFK